jgi:hypothetical protein
MMRAMQKVGIYTFRDKIYLVPRAQTSVGIWIDLDRITTCPQGVDNSLLGVALRETLDQSCGVVPHSAMGSWPVLDASHTDSRTFMSEAQHVLVTADETGIEFAAWASEGPDAGFAPVAGAKVRLKDATDAQVGAAARQALSLSHPWCAPTN